jgi:hypothetical protein
MVPWLEDVKYTNKWSAAASPHDRPQQPNVRYIVRHFKCDRYHLYLYLYQFIFFLKPNPYTPNYFITVLPKKIRLRRLQGGQLRGKGCSSAVGGRATARTQWQKKKNDSKRKIHPSRTQGQKKIVLQRKSSAGQRALHVLLLHLYRAWTPRCARSHTPILGDFPIKSE